jgi:hypothetical protein
MDTEQLATHDYTEPFRTGLYSFFDWGQWTPLSLLTGTGIDRYSYLYLSFSTLSSPGSAQRGNTNLVHKVATRDRDQRILHLSTELTQGRHLVSG